MQGSPPTDRALQGSFQPAAQASDEESRDVQGWMRAPVRAYRLVYTILFSAAWISAALIVASVTRSSRVPLRMARTRWAAGLFRWGRYDLDIENRGNVRFDEPFLIASNHRSFLDIPALFLAFPTELRFVVKAELARAPFLGWYIRAMGMVFVERKRAGKSRRRDVARVADILQQGSCVVAFPEGTRSRTKELLPFRTGVLAQAIEAGVPVVPVAIQGTADAYPPGFDPQFGAAVRVTIGEPISTEGLVPSQRKELAAQTRSRIEDLLATIEDPHA